MSEPEYDLRPLDRYTAAVVLLKKDDLVGIAAVCRCGFRGRGRLSGRGRYKTFGRALGYAKRDLVWHEQRCSMLQEAIAAADQENNPVRTTVEDIEHP